MLTEHQELIYSGKICPYCDSETKKVTEEFIYNKTYSGNKMICCVNFPKCNSYCGTHKEDESSLGRLADSSLRQYKKVAHSCFDPIWKDHKVLSRKQAYSWLSEKLEIPVEYTHIGYFNIETCKRVITICSEYLKTL